MRDSVSFGQRTYSIEDEDKLERLGDFWNQAQNDGRIWGRD
jgi:hypothetical protein